MRQYSKLMGMDTTKLAEAIAARLRVERARLNMTLKDAGKASGVHYVSISRYEQGKVPTVDALYRLAEVYGVDVSALLPPSAEVADLPKPKRGKKS